MTDPVPGTEQENDEAGHAPRNMREMLVANLRPQPAFPAVVVFFLCVLLPAMMHQPGAATGSIVLFIVPAGIVLSCGLAVAAGFCSLFPQLVWFGLAVWGLKVIREHGLPSYNEIILFTGMAAAVAMFVYQLWRVRSGQFVPTISDEK